MALWYANTLGWAIMPLHTPDAAGACSCPAGAGCNSAGKHPRTQHGVHDATTDKATIRDWWRQWPDANIGLAPGEASGVIVIDVDPRNGGLDTLRGLKEKPPATLVAITGGGGRHYFCKHVSGDLIGKLEGIDIQSDGRIIVLPPSQHASGKQYRWRDTTKPTKGIKLSPPPAWVFDTPGKKSRKGKNPATTLHQVFRLGARNEMLFKHGSGLRRMGADQDEIYAALLVKNRKDCEPPLDEREVYNIAQSCYRYPTEEQKAETLADLYPLTERGNAYRFRDLHANDSRWVPELGWLDYSSGTHWVVDKGNARTRKKTADVSVMILEEMAEVDDKEQKSYKGWHRSSESDRGVTATLRMSETLDEVRMEMRELDTDPWLFNVQNGTLDLRTGKLQPHRREDYITKIAPINYTPKAKAPRFLQFLDEIFQGDKDLILYLQKFFGYCLTGSVREQVFPILWGNGTNGKSTLIEHALPAVFGKESGYLAHLTASVLMQKKYEQHSTEIMDLRGARLAIAMESEKGKALDDEMIKRLTGGDRLKARRMHKDNEYFDPSHKLILVTNHKPRASAGAAMKRRLRLVPFTYEIPKPLRDDDLDKKLEAEAEGVLNWMIEGCLRWQEDGLDEPEVVSSATEKHMDDSDLLGMFLKEAVVFDKRYRCSADGLYQGYQLWCASSGLRSPLGKISFNREVADRESTIRKYVSGGQVRWQGLSPRLTIGKSR